MKRRRRPKPKTPPRPPRFSKAWLLDWCRTVALVTFFFIIGRTFLMATFVIDSGSMEETLLVGDFVLVNKVSLGAPIPFTNSNLPGYAQPEHGDTRTNRRATTGVQSPFPRRGTS